MTPLRHNEFVVNILEGALSGKRLGKTSTTILKSKSSETQKLTYSNEENGSQQFQMDSCQPIKRLNDKKIKPTVHTQPQLSPKYNRHSKPAFLLNTTLLCTSCL